MTWRVAIFDPVPMYARGIAATVGDQGFHPETPGDPVAWAGRAGRSAVILSVRSPLDWSLLGAVTQAAPEAVVLAVLDQVEPGGLARAIGAGASAVLARDASAQTVVDTLRAAVDGNSLVPLGILRRALAGGGPHPAASPLTTDEIDWLRDLAAGVTVARLADRVGYSERMMFRLLAGVYAKVGAENRTTALMVARDRGLF